MNTLYLSQVGPIEGPSPKPRSGHRIVYHKGKIYSFGGFNPAVDGADPGNEGSGGAHARPMTSDEAAEPERTDGPEELEVQEAQPKFQRSPADPTPEEIEAHECGGHIQFAGWCLDCIKGRAQEWGHYLADRANDSVPTIYWDYAYLSSPSEGIDNDEDERREEE